MKDSKPTNKRHRKKGKENQTSKVWVNPNSTFKGPRGQQAWEHRQLSPPTAARLLELADLALGSVQSSPWPVKKKKASA